jgi:glycosyltransferase involved in cell wall biosynthesis
MVTPALGQPPKLAIRADIERPSYRVGFVIEQDLGHVTVSRNLGRYVQDDQDVRPVWMPIEFEATGWMRRLPLVRSNWSVRASLLARRAIAQTRRQETLDALFIHTQVASLFAGPVMRAVPTIVSLDATPINMDSIGEFYRHKSGGPLEGLKFRVNINAFRQAAGLVTLCQWAKDSLVHDYGMPPEKISVIPTGVDLSLWPKRPTSTPYNDPKRVKLLFVGGDFKRKGGEVLLKCFQHNFQDRCELHLVTQEFVTPGPNLFVYHGVKPGSETLTRLFAEADLFVFPTLADCAPNAVIEALAASLPVISTRVGGISELVHQGKTGLLIDTNNSEQLRLAIEWMLDHPEQRAEMGYLGRRLIEADYDAEKNCRRLLEVIKAAAERTPTRKC